MLNQTIFDFTGSDAVAGGLEHVVSASLVPEIAVTIRAGEVAGAAPIAAELGVRGSGIAPVFEKKYRIGIAVNVAPVNRDLASGSLDAALP